MLVTKKLDTQVTHEAIERNFLKLNSYIETTDRLIATQEFKLTKEQEDRMAAIAESVEKANKALEARVKSINSLVYATKSSQMELLEALDKEKVSAAVFTEEVNKLVQVDGENKALIEETAESVTTIVGNLNAQGDSPYTSIAAIKVKADEIQQTVSNHDGAISGIKQRADSIEQVVATKADAASVAITNQSISLMLTELNKPPEDCSYSAITALKDQVDLAVQGVDGLTGERLVSRINLSPAGVKLAGKMIEVDGNTVFKGNVDITGKLTASNLGALSNGVIGTLRTATTGARTEIRDNLILIYDENNVLRVRMGVW